MANMIFFEKFFEDIAHGVHNLGTDTLKVALTNDEPDAAVDTQLGDITEIAGGNGYAAGGNDATLVSSSQTGGVYKLILADCVFTASGGSMAEFRYAVLYNADAANDELIGYYDRGSGLVVGSGDTFTVDFDGAEGAVQLGAGTLA
jgi:hypothetical protein